MNPASLGCLSLCWSLTEATWHGGPTELSVILLVKSFKNPFETNKMLLALQRLPARSQEAVAAQGTTPPIVCQPVAILQGCLHMWAMLQHFPAWRTREQVRPTRCVILNVCEPTFFLKTPSASILREVTLVLALNQEN